MATEVAAPDGAGLVRAAADVEAPVVLTLPVLVVIAVGFGYEVLV